MMSENGPVLHLFAKVGNQNIKHLSAALHLLQKVGKELIIETENGILIFRSLNDTKSAFTSVEFDKGFFENFTTASRADNFSCKVAIKVIKCCVFYSHLSVGKMRFLSFQFICLAI